MSLMNDKPVAIVAGGSRGIGKAIVLKLAQLGYNLTVSHVRLGSADEIGREAAALGAHCIPVQGDISRTADRAELVRQTRETFGRCDLLVNNAGVAPTQRTDILQATEDSFDRVLNINLKGPYFLTQLVANWMIEQRGQFPHRPYRIVTTGSISAYTSSPNRGEYCLSKAGIGMLTALYADRLAEYNIGVFETRPGIIATDMTAATTEKYDRLIREGITPIKRWGQPQDVADAVAAIALGLLDFCTGQVINVDGGFHLRRL